MADDEIADLDEAVSESGIANDDGTVANNRDEIATGELPEVRSVSFDLYVEGTLVDSEPLLETEPGRAAEVAERQDGLARAAVGEGKKFMVDVVFWTGEHVRWGNDVDGESVPVEDGVTALAAALDKHFSKGPCDAVKMGYVCMRGAGHMPADLHAQLVAVIDAQYLRVAMWNESWGGVRVTRVQRQTQEAQALERHAVAPGEAVAVADG